MSISTPLPTELQAATAGESVSNAPGEREHQLMAKFFITYNGRHYEYHGYRYDSLADAVNYARHQRAKPPGKDEVEPRPSQEDVEMPNETQRQLMASLGITFQDGVYHLGTFQYDHLADAVDYARRLSPAAIPPVQA